MDITDDMVTIPLAGKKPIKKAFIESTGLQFGYELDLLDPNDMHGMVRAALDLHTDHEALEMAETLAEQNNAEIDVINAELTEVLAPVREKHRRM